MALFCTLSNFSLSFMKWEHQNWRLYSCTGLTNAVHGGKITSVSLLTTSLNTSKDHMSPFCHHITLGAPVELPVHYDL